MLRWNYGRTMILLIGGLGVLALAPQADSAKPLRPAATTPSPEDAQLKQLPPPASPQQLAKPSKAELMSRCQQRPTCRAKLEVAQKGQKPATARPAATSPSPEDLELKKLPAPATPETPRRFQRSGLGLWPLDGLLAWLNPFRPKVAEAQAAVSVHLTPQNPYVASPSSSLALYGVVYNGSYFFPLYMNTYRAPSENRPFAQTAFSAPVSGWYIINLRASSAAAKLRHYPSNLIIETWGPAAVPCSAGGVCDHLTIEYLQQGYHTLYFYSLTHQYYFYSASIESYP